VRVHGAVGMPVHLAALNLRLAFTATADRTHGSLQSSVQCATATGTSSMSLTRSSSPAVTCNW
jgi:hypothetical protein